MKSAAFLSSKTSHRFMLHLLLFSGLFLISLVLFFRILNFNFITDDYYLLWVSRFHPEKYGVYWGHPSTVFEFFLLYKLFGANVLAFSIFSIFLRSLAAFAGYVFISKLTKSKITGIICSLLFVTSYIGYQATTWASAHIVYVDLILVTFTAYQYLVYLEDKTRK